MSIKQYISLLRQLQPAIWQFSLTNFDTVFLYLQIECWTMISLRFAEIKDGFASIDSLHQIAIQSKYKRKLFDSHSFFVAIFQVAAIGRFQRILFPSHLMFCSFFLHQPSKRSFRWYNRIDIEQTIQQEKRKTQTIWQCVITPLLMLQWQLKLYGSIVTPLKIHCSTIPLSILLLLLLFTFLAWCAHLTHLTISLFVLIRNDFDKHLNKVNARGTGNDS